MPLSLFILHNMACNKVVLDPTWFVIKTGSMFDHDLSLGIDTCTSIRSCDVVI